ncbi:MAG: ATP-binding protein [Candidatus Eremiobacteraeota bacterium]|nr:ATP-binding protein [Candidatus Eremiobacteraeota bacterium]
MSASERRTLASRIPELSSVARQLQRTRAGSAIPLLYVEFCNLDSRRTSAGVRKFRAACKQATAAALKAAVGSILRQNDLVAAGRGGQWFIAVLIGRDIRAKDAGTIDADLGLAAERLRQNVQTALHALVAGNAAGPRVAVRCGWNVFEPASAADSDVREALRHAIRGAALVGRVEERRALVLSAVTHELRTPLTSIIGYTERLQSGTTTLTQRAHWLAIIAEEARRLHRLTEGLIDVGAWSAGGLHLRLARCALRPIADAALKSLADRARDKKVRLTISGDAIARVDRDRVLQILINLLDNALRHTPPGARIGVRVSRNGALALIEVRDGGPGFSSEARSAGATPFSAGSNGKTGLGLAIADVLVKAHGGRLKLGGSNGSGGLVSVTLPLEKAANIRVAGANTRL